MIALFRRLADRSRHARPEMLSRYLDGELTQPQRRALETHLGDCPNCRRLVESLTGTVDALGSMRTGARAGLADSVIGALRAQSPSQRALPAASARRSGSPLLTVVSDSGSDAAGQTATVPRARSTWRCILRAFLDYCLRRPQLRLTLPLGLALGIALSLINKGYMIFNGRVDAEMCAVCALDFVIPFVALNVGLLLAARVAARRRG
jgi:anti-sigma factor RsiW